MIRIAVLAVMMASSQIEDAPLTLSALQADYKGKAIYLKGDVTVEHDLGKMKAQDVEIHSLPGEKKLRPGFLLLKDKVNIVLMDNGQLSCDAAVLDYEAMKGDFTGNVIYTEACKGRRNETIPIIVKSGRMVLNIESNDVLADGNPKSYVRQIIAENDVNVNYNHDFIASADKGVYQRRSIQEEGAKPAGHIALTTATPNGRCKVINRNGDLINASRIDIDSLSKELLFTDAKGTIGSSRVEGEQSGKIGFCAQSLLWNSADNRLTLSRDVVINQPGMGKMTVEGDVHIFQQVQGGRKQLSRLEADGKCVISCNDPDSSIEHIITCFGKASVDHFNLITTLDSPVNGKGKVSENEQVSFQDPLGEIYADKARLHYTVDNNKISLSKIELEGNVRLKDRKAGSDEVLHYALADFVQYDPALKELYFSAKPKRRVLFYDKVNNVQVSAPALNVKRDEMTKKESIKGVGDVRFSFLDGEYALLRKRFKLDNPEEAQ